MSITTTRVSKNARSLRQGRAPFRMRPIAAVIAGMSMMISGSVYAADPSVAELQAQIAQLKQIIEAQNAALGNAQPKTDGTTPKDAVAKTAAAPDEQQTLGEVTVRAASAPALAVVQDIPASISVVSGAELASLGATDITAIAQRLGNITYNVGNQRTNSLSIRGIGKIGQLEAQDPSVGITVDGVSYAFNPLISSYDFNDIDTVEGLRGPQGALGGKSANLGVINIATKQPSFTPSAEYSLIMGEKDTIKGYFAAGGPIEDGVLAYRATLTADKGSGMLTNLVNNDQTYGNTDRVAGKLQFLLTPSRDFSARFEVDAQPNSNEYTNSETINTRTPPIYTNGSSSLSKDPSVILARSWFTRDANYTYAGNYLNGAGGNFVDLNAGFPLVTNTHGATAELNWKLGTATLTSITGYRDYHFNAVNDEGTPFDIAYNNGGVWDDYRQASQEFRLTSDLGGVVDYQTGLYFLRYADNNHDQKSLGSDAGAWFASTAQYNVLNANPAGQLLMQNSLNRLSLYYNSPDGSSDIENSSTAAYGQANWHLSDKWTLTTGLRITHDVRNNTGSSSIIDNGVGGALNPVAVNGVQTGGFSSNSTTGALTGTNSTAQLNLADQVAAQYFGVAATGTPGGAYNSLTAAQQAQVAAAKSIRAAQIGVLFNQTTAQPFSGNDPTVNISPSYKINENLSTYVSYQLGVKAGISQFTNGISNPVKAEKTQSYEWGIKSALLDKTLLLNADLFLMNITNYQQAVKVLDVYTTNLNNDGNLYYTSADGNVPAVQAKGLEVDGVYSGIKNTTVRFSGAYNNAYYKHFPNSAQPVESGYTGAAPYVDVSGQTLPGAAKLTLNLGLDYRVPLPVLNDKVFHTTLNSAFTSKYNSDASLSQYAWIHANTLTDVAFGIANQKNTYDVSLLVKNISNTATPLVQTWNSYQPENPRWIGIMVSGKL